MTDTSFNDFATAAVNRAFAPTTSELRQLREKNSQCRILLIRVAGKADEKGIDLSSKITELAGLQNTYDEKIEACLASDNRTVEDFCALSKSLDEMEDAMKVFVKKVLEKIGGPNPPAVG